MRCKVKSKKVKMPMLMKDEGLGGAFNQMLGAENTNVIIAYPRYLRMKRTCEQLVKLFDMLSQSPFMRKHSEFANQKAELDHFCVSAHEKISQLFNVDFADYSWDLNLINDELKKAFIDSYTEMKKSHLINTFIIMCDRLVIYKKNFADLNNMNHRFVTTMPGIEWTPFPFTTLNIKHIFALDDVQDNIIQFFMTVFNKAFELSYSLYNEVIAPDVDMKQFVGVLLSNIEEIQKRPELSRCKKAFQKIHDSIGLLQDNFNDYYRDFITTKDSTIIMQHFILDVGKKTSSDPETTRQFREIINYYRKIAGSQIKNPKVKMLFDKVNSSFERLEKDTENLVKIRKHGDSDGGPDMDADTGENISAMAGLSINDILGE